MKEVLLLPYGAGREVLERYGFGVEAPTSLKDPAIDPVADLVVSAHALYSKDGIRLSIADVDDSRRSASIAEIVAYIEAAVSRFPNLRQINMHASPKRFLYEQFMLLGDYARLIDAIREIATTAAKHGLNIVVENNRAYWDGVPDDTEAETVDRREQNDYFATAPEEWRQVQIDVDRPNVSLCLDTSHACTYAQTVENLAEREAIMMRYLEAGDALKHFHWNGNDLLTNAGRQDKHFSLHEDSLPEILHARIKTWEGTRLLEHWYGEEKLEGELKYIGTL